MVHFLWLLGATLWLRPYVFVFLGVYLLLATWHLGAGRALAFLCLGYLISWIAELCSIHWGFPFGEYLYIHATSHQELWVAGVPFMDSLSYVFLAYASYTLALLALCRGREPGDGFAPEEDEACLNSWRPVVLGAVLMVTLDIIIDPLALRGYRWFLVALILIRVLQCLATRVPARPVWDWGRRRFAGQALLGPALYLGILAFNLSVTFLIGETCLGWVGVFIYLPFFTWLILRLIP